MADPHKGQQERNRGPSLKVDLVAYSHKSRRKVAKTVDPYEGGWALKQEPQIKDKGLKEFVVVPKNNAKPTYCKNGRFTEEQRKWIQLETDRLLKEGRIEPIQSLSNSPLNLVEKGNAYRLTVNFRTSKVNDSIENDSYQLPLIMEKLQSLTKYKVFDKLDLSNGFWNVKTSDLVTKQWLAFEIPDRGQFTWNVLPQGLKTAPSIFQERMDMLFANCNNQGHDVRPYVDDIIYGASSETEQIAKREIVLKILADHELKLNHDKTILCQPEIEALGYIISYQKVRPKDDYINAIIAKPTPTSTTKVRNLLGKLNHVSRMYPTMAQDKWFLATLLKKNKTFQWNEKYEACLKNIKTLLLKPIPLSCLKQDVAIEVYTDAGDDGF